MGSLAGKEANRKVQQKSQSVKELTCSHAIDMVRTFREYPVGVVGRSGAGRVEQPAQSIIYILL